MSRSVAVVTGSRADFGLLRPTIRAIESEPRLDLHLIATAMHLDPRFGTTIREIESDEIAIAARLQVDLDAPVPARIAALTIDMSRTFARLDPVIVLLLGDRYEMLAAALGTIGTDIVVAHLHGGELSQGSLDDAMRHCITKLAHLHFPATREYAERVCQLGEDPANVHVVGAASVESIRNLPLLSLSALEAELGVRLQRPLVALSLHPSSLDPDAAPTEAAGVLAGLDDALGGRGTVILTLPNDDPGGRGTTEALRRYADGRSNVKLFASLGQLRYLSLLSNADAVVGNSSSALIEAPVFELPAVDVGNRQQGRHKPANVIEAPVDRAAIRGAVERALDPSFRASLRGMTHPYGDGDASRTVTDLLATVDLARLRRKRFYDIPDSPWRAGLGFKTP